jgi:hypothetical protein
LFSPSPLVGIPKDAPSGDTPVAPEPVRVLPYEGGAVVPGVVPDPDRRFVVEKGPEFAENAVFDGTGADCTFDGVTAPVEYGFTMGLAVLPEGRDGIMGFCPAGADGAP